MSKFKTMLALVACAFLTASPLVAAEIGAPTAPKIPAAPEIPAVAKPDPAAAVKEKAVDVVDKAKSGLDEKVQGLKQGLDAKKDAAKEEVLEVTKETVTVETPKGVGQETVITVTPETPAAPGTPSIPTPESK